MRMKGVLAVACAALVAMAGQGGGGSEAAKYWVFFRDKGVVDVGEAVGKAARALPERIRVRWERAEWPGDAGDLPVSEVHQQALREAGIHVLRSSRWLNAVSARLSPDQKLAIENMPFVLRTQPVAVYRRPVEPIVPGAPITTGGRSVAAHTMNYGPSLSQWQMVQVPLLHDLGHTGSGVTICMMDTGFKKDHEVFANTTKADEWDFIFDDGNTQDEAGDTLGAESHGTSTWSLTGGRKDGTLIGGAFSARFLLAKTEDIRSETVVEEDNWVAALEWADERGADIVSSSLSYSDWYSPSDFDGRTAITSIAASAAAKRGILVVSSVGNEGPDPQTLTAPADAFGIVAVGAVDSGRRIASFSSRGPSADGRTKPEVSAQGVNAFVASSFDATDYGTGSGTSFACPITAGAAGALLSARRDWSPMQLREALMMTASRASAPDNNYGRGIVQILAAYDYLPRNAVEIDHTPLGNKSSAASGYKVTAVIRAYWGLDESQVFLFYRTATAGAFQSVPLQKKTDNTFSATIPRQPGSTTVSYYLQAKDTKGRKRRRPYDAPTTLYSFRVMP